MLFFRGKQIPRCARDDRNGVVQTFPSAAQARPRAALPRPRIAIQPAGCRTMTPMPDTLPDWLAWIERQHPRSIDMGLERVREVAARIGLARPARHVITVGGTTGKGPTVAFIEAIARAAGWKVGAYTPNRTRLGAGESVAVRVD